MSWHGSLTCTYCYERGHTRRKCPQMKQRHDEYEALLAEGKEKDATWGQRGAWREYKQQQEGLKESNKQCAFCGKHGHRVNTCPDRLAVVDKLKELDKWFVPIALQSLEDIGLGIGTVIRGRGYVGNDYRSDIPMMITKTFQGRGDRGGMSVINLWEDHWLAFEATNMVTMQTERVTFGHYFRWSLIQNLWHVLDMPEGYDFNERAYHQREYTSENPLATQLGYLPTPVDVSDLVVSSMSKPVEYDETMEWNYAQKREVNKLFRDSKTALVSERMQYNVSRLHKALKERGVL